MLSKYSTRCALVFFSFVLLAGCSSTKINSYNNPDYKNSTGSFYKILVVCNTNKQDYRVQMENYLIEAFANEGIKATASFKLFPAELSGNDSLKVLEMKNDGLDGCLVINVGETGTKTVHIPVIGSMTYGRPASTNSGYNSPYTIDTRTDYIGGGSFDKLYAEFDIKFYDLYNGAVVWSASSHTGENAYYGFNDIYKSFSKKLIDKLTDEVSIKYQQEK